MLLKTVLSAMLLFTAVQAQEVKMIPLKFYNLPGHYADGSMDILLNYHDSYEHPYDWIGIYKKGDSNAWKNVVAWKWTKDMDSGSACPTDHCDESYTRFLRVQLEDGDYEARFFRDNSFVLEQKLDFTVKAVESYVTRLIGTYSAYYNRLTMEISGTSKEVPITPNDWIGLYKVGDSNDWKNVKKWTWATKNLSDGYRIIWDLNNLDVETGDYELRYFLKNSFVTHKKSEPFHFIKDNENPVMKHDLMVAPFYRGAYIHFKNASGNKKDWYGVFKKADEPNRANAIAWSYNTKGLQEANNYLRIEQGLLEVGEYKLVWFENDSDKVLAESKLTIKDFFDYSK